jgi:NADPH-dependent ferric siderophore reductase
MAKDTACSRSNSQDGGMTDSAALRRARRPPPPFRRVTVHRTQWRSPRLVRVTLAGRELAGFRVDDPAASVRLLVPQPGHDELVLPSWTGNEWLLENGQRPAIRTFTPRRADPEAAELDLEIVVHGRGVASEWAAAATPGQPAAISGPARGYRVDPDAQAFLIAGDETALAAIGQLLEVLPPTTPVEVHIEIADAVAQVALPEHPRARLSWHVNEQGAPPGAAMVGAIQAAELSPGVRVWVAGEAAAVQRVRRHLFEERGLSRSHASVRGYWKQGRAGDGDEETDTSSSPTFGHAVS